jgi:hypothetical protein
LKPFLASVSASCRPKPVSQPVMKMALSWPGSTVASLIFEDLEMRVRPWVD